MIQENVTAGIKEAMKARDAVRLNALRGIKTAFTNELVAKKRTPQSVLSDEEAVVVLTRLSKQRKDSIDQFTKGGRLELAEKESQELAIIEEFLPEMMTGEDIRKVVEEKKAALGISDPTKAGMLIGAVMKELKGKADGRLVKEVVENVLAGYSGSEKL